MHTIPELQRSHPTLRSQQPVTPMQSSATSHISVQPTKLQPLCSPRPLHHQTPTIAIPCAAPCPDPVAAPAPAAVLPAAQHNPCAIPSQAQACPKPSPIATLVQPLPFVQPSQPTSL
ncbi:hypothetical protein Acr_00g0103680 [Actinidia rufa]|uniref:Uncharacterized protein n=1 Tax=Actinidia rufa TaxID=165716 RepID=A0A7J0E0Q4_9ERIC|nr:hypothetical protein Acr_00g0103680 [Actinidia rufa]